MKKILIMKQALKGNRSAEKKKRKKSVAKIFLLPTVLRLKLHYAVLFHLRKKKIEKTTTVPLICSFLFFFFAVVTVVVVCVVKTDHFY